MRNRRQVMTIIVFGLIGIGILYRLFHGAKSLIIAAVVFGIIFILYKFPPQRWTVWLRSRPSSRRSKRRRKHHLRVIDGKKNNDDPPPFH